MKKIAALLRDGEPRTLRQLVNELGLKYESVWYACKTHPLIYIDHWRIADGAAAQWVAVYAIADEPVDTPRPTIKPQDYKRDQANH